MDSSSSSDPAAYGIGDTPEKKNPNNAQAAKLITATNTMLRYAFVGEERKQVEDNYETGTKSISFHLNKTL